MKDSAKGSVSGYLFQFEKALLLLSSLDHDSDYISIESVDDIASHKENGTVLITNQAKHSITNSGQTFEDTSYSLWRTFEIWIIKLNEKVFNNSTKFVCCSNKEIKEKSLLRYIKQEKFDVAISKIEALLVDQQNKIQAKRDKGSKISAASLEIVKLIEFTLSNRTAFEIIKNNLEIEALDNIKEQFYNRIHINVDMYDNDYREKVFTDFYGWLTYSSFAYWKQTKEAVISKKMFNEKYSVILFTPSLTNNIFRTREMLGTIEESVFSKNSTELFVRQIEDLPLNTAAKQRAVKNAIRDFIYSEIEIAHIVSKGVFTQEDFEIFIEDCRVAWQTKFDAIFPLEIESYSADEKTKKAIEIFNFIMSDIQILFKDKFGFTSSNAYFKNGCFLQLSNEPKIGWHPEWDKLYVEEYAK